MESLYLGGPTIQEADGEMTMGLSIYGVAVIDGSLYSRFYGTALISGITVFTTFNIQREAKKFLLTKIIILFIYLLELFPLKFLSLFFPFHRTKVAFY